jgi:hypothetical protein
MGLKENTNMFGTNVKKAVEAATSASAGNATFTPDELKTLRLAPLLVGMLISSSAPSGLIGSAREAGAVMATITEAARNANTGLIKTIFGSGMAEGDQASLMDIMKNAKSPDELKTNLLAAIGSAGKLVAKGSAAEADGYKHMLASVAHKVAEATKEGGFLGIGGVSVNDAEKAAIASVEQALGVTKK